jgi:hypothetical protein
VGLAHGTVLFVMSEVMVIAYPQGVLEEEGVVS